MKTLFLALAAILWCPKAFAMEFMQVPVMVDQQQICTAEIRSASPQGDLSIAASELSLWIEREMQPETLASYRQNMSPEGILHINTSNILGLRVFYDPVDSVIRLVPDPAYRLAQHLRLSQTPDAARAIIAPANVSGFVNFRTGMDYLYDQPVNGGRQGVQADIDAALQVKGTVLESLINYAEDEERSFSRGETRLVRDWPDKMIRAAAGDLAYPVSGFQSYQPMLGVSVARNFSLQPYRVTTPSGETSFTLRSASQVEVQVNGRTVRTFRLEPGTYDMSDFPVTDGGNDVTLLITDATGNVERKTFPLLSDQQLLTRGLHAFSYNIGMESETEDRKIDYGDGDAGFSFFHRYGFTDALTAGIGAQADQDVQQATAVLIRAFDIGVFGVEAGASRAPFSKGAAAGRLSFRRVDIEKGRIYSAETSYRQRGFTGLGYFPGMQAPGTVFDNVARVTQSFPTGLNIGVGGRFRKAQGPLRDDWSVGVSVDKSFQSGISISATAEHQREGGAGIFMTLSWSPPLSRHSMTASVDTISGTQSLDWDYRSDYDVHSFRGGIGVTHYNEGNRNETTGDIGYTGYRGEFLLRHDVIATGATAGEASARTHVQAGTAVVFADGHAAISRPVTGSFILFPDTDIAEDTPIGINPAYTAADQADPDYQAAIDGFGGAVIPDAMAYMYRPIQVDTRHLPIGYDIGADHFTVLPAYKTGTLISLEQEARLSVTGILTDKNGNVLPLQGGEMSHMQAGKEVAQSFFTNEQGRFEISQLKAGDYHLRLFNFSGSEADITVAAKKTGIIDVGRIVLMQKEEAP